MIGFAGHHQIYSVVLGYFSQLQVETDGQRERHLPDSNTKKRLLEVASISKRRFLLFSQYLPPG
jgi:hypothetical protein